MSDRSQSQQLLLEIAHCPHVEWIRSNPAGKHPCANLVRSQNKQRHFQLPEPWSGDIESAPILFLGANPSIAHCTCTDDQPCAGEKFPTSATADDTIIDFFSRRFGAPWAQITPSGPVKTLRHDGKHRTGGGTFWGWARNRAKQILGRDPVIGTDFALTEVVHCKSRGVAAGVTPDCVATCTALYLNRVLAIAGARVVVCVGKQAHTSIQKLYPGTVPVDGGTTAGPVSIAGRCRCFAFLTAPAASGSHKTLTSAEVAVLRRCLYIPPQA